MFGRVKSFDDPELGPLQRARGAWRGTVRLGSHGPIPLAVPGSRSEPDAAALALAQTIPAEYDYCRAAIDNGLDEHRSTILAGDGPAPAQGALPQPSSAAVIEFDGALTIQLAYRVEWDDDHTLGACLRGGELIELNGSILEP
jgi:hypothetical protein